MTLSATIENNSKLKTVIKIIAAVAICAACMFFYSVQAQAAGTINSETGELTITDAALGVRRSINYGKPTTVTVDGAKYTQVTVSSALIEKYGAYTAIQFALNYARDTATSSSPVLVKVKEGKYKISYALRMYSNTYLDAEGVTFTQTAGAEDNMIKIAHGANETDITGYYYTNITINGGTWDENGGSCTLISLMHAKNVTVQNATFKNTVDAHLMETAGVNGLTISNCTFKDQEISENAMTGTKIYEAIQLDIFASEHIKTYNTEDLPMKNVVITGCTFSNVPRGIGSHTGVLNNPINGLTITNNTFNKINSCAIQIMNAKNVTISGNTITKAARGIFVYSYQKSGTYKASDLSSSSSTSNKYKTPTDYNIVIKNNKITVYGGDKYNSNYPDAAVYIGGANISTGGTNSYGYSLPSGNYYITGVSVCNNKIVTYGHGIKIYDARNITISSNSITYKGTAYKKSTDTKYYTIAVSGRSKNITIKNNATSKSYCSIYFVDGSTCDYIKGNTLKNASRYGITVKASTVTNITGNMVTGAGKYGIYLLSSAKATYIKSNTITNAGGSGIVVKTSTVANITGNTITSPGKYGIYIISKSKVTNIKTNKIKKVASVARGIKRSGSTVKTISGNTIKAA